VLFDAVVLPAGDEAVDALGEQGLALDFVKEQYRHCKAMLVLGEAQRLTEAAGILAGSAHGEPDPGVVVADNGALKSALPAFIKAVGRHRHFERQTDPPLV
jgi:catalase